MLCVFDMLQAEASAGNRYSVVTELMLRLLGLDYVADTMVISGRQATCTSNAVA